MPEKTADNIHRNIRTNLDQELENLTGELAQVDLQHREITREKRWVDWVKKFEDQFDSLDDLPQEDRKQYIEALVDRLVVKLDDETKEHLVEVRFQLPIVKDQLVYRDETEKSLGYDIEEGMTSVLIRQNLQDRAGSKKIKFRNGLGETEYVLLKPFRHHRDAKQPLRRPAAQRHRQPYQGEGKVPAKHPEGTGANSASCVKVLGASK
jgi:hypothetical protein